MLTLLNSTSLGGPQAGTAGAWISCQFFLAGGKGMARGEKQAGIVTESMLDAAILERVKTDHTKSSTRGNALGYSPQGRLERSKFLVDGDTQGLEETSCRVDLLAAVGRVNIRDQGGEVDCPL